MSILRDHMNNCPHLLAAEDIMNNLAEGLSSYDDKTQAGMLISAKVKLTKARREWVDAFELESREDRGMDLGNAGIRIGAINYHLNKLL